MKKTILLFGGSSEERLVSVASAQNIAKRVAFSKILFLHKSGTVHLVPIEELLAHHNPFTNEFNPTSKPVSSAFENAFEELKGHIVFLALHGTQGEDGTLQRWLESQKIPFTGSGSVASRAAFEKDQAKAIVAKAGLAVAPELVVSQKTTNVQAALKDFFQQHRKIVLKPLANGSSIGLHIVSDMTTLEKVAPAVLSGNFGDYLAEKFLVGRELTVGVIDHNGVLKPLPPSEVIMETGRSFDYEGKYLGKGTTEITPAVLTDAERSSAQAMAIAAHKALGCYGYTRTDIMLTTSGPVFIETNTLPGLSKASFVPQQLAANNETMEDFIHQQLALAEKRY